MKLLSLIFPVAIFSAALHVSPATAADMRAATQGFDCRFHHVIGSAIPTQKSDDHAALDAVLKKMDSVAANFRTTQAEFEWDNYQRAIDEVVDVETGAIYYRRNGNEIEMMANVKKSGTSLSDLKPEQKYVLFSDGKVKMYSPKIDQLTVYDLGKNRADLESFVVLGFGGSGQDLLKIFDVTYGGTENIGGIQATKLSLVPKSEKVRRSYNKMILWIDPDKGVSIQQQFFTPQEDHRLCKYSAIKVNEKIDNDVFKLKTTNKTQTISPGS